MVDVDDLATVAVIARRFGMASETVRLWTAMRGFPAPVLAEESGGVLWVLSEVEVWRKSTRTPHGMNSRYNNGCRCGPCRDAHTAWARERRSQSLAPDDPRHGTVNGYNNYGCRCEPCRAVGSELNRRARERRKAKREGGDAA